MRYRMNTDIEPVPEEFTELKYKALRCNNPEEAFKLKYEIDSWNVDCFDVTELEDASKNYDEALDNIEKVIDNYLHIQKINPKKYRNVTNTQNLEQLLKRYLNPRIIELGEIKLLTWKKDTYILSRSQKIERYRIMRKAWKEEKKQNYLVNFRNYKEFVNKIYGIPINRI